MAWRQFFLPNYSVVTPFHGTRSPMTLATTLATFHYWTHRFLFYNKPSASARCVHTLRPHAVVVTTHDTPSAPSWFVTLHPPSCHLRSLGVVPESQGLILYKYFKIVCEEYNDSFGDLNHLIQFTKKIRILYSFDHVFVLESWFYQYRLYCFIDHKIMIINMLFL